jgi:hypothetical protein
MDIVIPFESLFPGTLFINQAAKVGELNAAAPIYLI